MTGAHPYFTYTTEIAAWRLGPQEPGSPLPPACDPDRAAVRAGRIVRAARDRRHVVLLGLGTGELAAALAASLPPDTGLTVLCPDPAVAVALREAGRLPWHRPESPHQLLADTSRQALFCLPAMVGDLGPGTLVTANPESPPPIREALVQVRRFCTESIPLPPSSPPAAPELPLTLAVLARPEEPDLGEFFKACRGLATETVILWDAPDVPGRAREAELLAMPVRHLARPLGHDFAAQRNALLAACPPGWIVALDPDERPGADFRETLRRLMTAPPGLAGAFFPRLTLYPDAGHAKAGHGLWPDLQLRLFSNVPPSRPRYVRPVHERLEGLEGFFALALDAPLLHLNRLLTDETAVAAKLAAYDTAAGQPRHHLSQAYPALPLGFFTALAMHGPGGRVLRLPTLW